MAAQDLTVRLEDTGDTATYAVGTVAVDGSDTWKKYSLTLTSTGTTDADLVSARYPRR